MRHRSAAKARFRLRRTDRAAARRSRQCPRHCGSQMSGGALWQSPPAVRRSKATDWELPGAPKLRRPARRWAGRARRVWSVFAKTIDREIRPAPFSAASIQTLRMARSPLRGPTRLTTGAITCTIAPASEADIERALFNRLARRGWQRRRDRQAAPLLQVARYLTIPTNIAASFLFPSTLK